MSFWDIFRPYQMATNMEEFAKQREEELAKAKVAKKSEMEGDINFATGPKGDAEQLYRDLLQEVKASRYDPTNAYMAGNRMMAQGMKNFGSNYSGMEGIAKRQAAQDQVVSPMLNYQNSIQDRIQSELMKNLGLRTQIAGAYDNTQQQNIRNRMDAYKALQAMRLQQEQMANQKKESGGGLGIFGDLLSYVPVIGDVYDVGKKLFGGDGGNSTIEA